MKLQLVLLLCFLTIIHARFIKRFFGGRNLQPGTFSNVVRVIGEKGRKVRLFSNGVICNEKWIAVVSECIDRIRRFELISNVRVIAGQWDRTVSEESEQTRAVVLSRHYSDTDNSLYGKSVHLGLLKLDRALEFGEFVSAIPFSTDFPNTSRPAVIVGWGSTTRTEISVRWPSKIIQIIDVDVIPKNECMAAIELMIKHGGIFSPNHFNRFNFCTGAFRPNFIAGTNSAAIRKAAYGNDGSPVMQADEQGQYKVIGINFEFITVGNLSIHTPFFPFIDWIQDEIIN